MVPPVSNFPPTALPYSQLMVVSPSSHFWRGVLQRERNGTVLCVPHTIWKPPSGKTPISSNLSCSTSNDDSEVNHFGKKDRIHFVGVGGCGMSALAMLTVKHGYEVSGSDVEWSSYMDPLKEAGASLHIGHSELNVLRINGAVASILPDAVVVSSAIPPDNIEILTAKSSAVPVYKRGAWLGKLTKDYNLIAVSGTHGKSTTSSMLAYVLKAMGDDLTALIGAQVPQFSGANFIYGNGQNFVLEADEYDVCFLELSPYIAVVTNVDWDHVDIYPDEEAVITVFKEFLGKIRTGGHLILYGDRHDQNPGAYSLLNYPEEASEPCLDVESLSTQVFKEKYHVTTYGLQSYTDWQASSVSLNALGGCDYKLYHQGEEVDEISLQLSGLHNVLNSLAVIAALSVIHGDGRQTINAAKPHLKNFTSISRRFELIGEFHGCHIIDDYAHHPNEVRAALQAARQKFPLKDILPTRGNEE